MQFMRFQDLFSMPDTFESGSDAEMSGSIMNEWDHEDEDYEDHFIPNLFGAEGNARNREPNNAPSNASNNVTSEGFLWFKNS